MAGKDQGRFNDATGSLFAGDNEDLETCVENLRSRDLTCLTAKLSKVIQGSEKAK